MAALQGRVANRAVLQTDPKQLAIDSTAKDVAAILHPLLVETLHPRTFTGNIAISLHFQDGNVSHIKVLDSDELEPGSAREPNKSTGEAEVANVLESAIRDLRLKLASISSGYFGVVTLTIEIEWGICILVTWARERVHRRNSARCP